MNIPFNIPYISGQEMFYLKTALSSGHYGSEGMYIDRCTEWFFNNYQVPAVYLTPSCTLALEMAAIIIGIQPGDQVIVPSFTHVSSANAFVRCGAEIVFADVDSQHMTIDVNDAASRITPKTKAIVAVHYGGYPADVISLKKICDQNKLFLVEDAAHSIGCRLNGKHHGTVGHLGCLSFHESKNIQCGEGGALLVNDDALLPTSEIIFDKGTNRQSFLRNEIPKYEWLRVGSSFAMNNISAAVLSAQLQDVESVNYRRTQLWYHYRNVLGDMAQSGSCLLLPPEPDYPDDFNAHVFFIKATTPQVASDLCQSLINQGVSARFHFPALHSSPFGKQFTGDCPVAEQQSRSLIRLPLYDSLTTQQIDRIAQLVNNYLH